MGNITGTVRKNGTVVAGSRESELSVRQTKQVIEYIVQRNPGMSVEIMTMKTTGDRILDRRLDQVGGKGLFVKELDQALRERKTDFSVHSLKDMPAEVPEDLPILAFSKREDPRDVLVLAPGLKELDLSKPVGCSSKRRILQFQMLYPHAQMKAVRGNVPSRLRKLDCGEYGALILAAAGLKRLGLEERISRYFTVDEMIPSAGQGILCVQGRKDEEYEYLDGFGDADARDEALAERAFTAALGGGCTSPMAAYAQVEGERIILRGLYYEEESGRVLKGTLEGQRDFAQEAGKMLAQKICK